jgi:superfamily II DNA/RNA helicase
MPEDTDTYLHRVARAGRFGTKVIILICAASLIDCFWNLKLCWSTFFITRTDIP